MLYYLLISNALALLVLGSGVYALRKLGWLDHFHHLWLVFAAFVFGPATILDIVVRTAAIVIAADDAIQHVIQWHQWHTRMAKEGWTKAGASVTAPDEGTGWPGIYRSILHRAYWWVVQHLEKP